MFHSSRFILLAIVAVCATGQYAHADLVFRNVNVTLDASQIESYDLDVDLDGTIDFTLTSAFVPDPDLPVGFNTFDFPFAGNNGVVIDAQTNDGFPTITRLSLGDIVSGSHLFSSASFDQGNLTFFTAFDPPSGNFLGQSGFVGLRFDRPGGTVFGFAQISVNAMDAPTNPLGLSIGIVGYNDSFGGPAAITAVPEPSSMLMAAAFLAIASVRSRRGTVICHSSP